PTPTCRCRTLTWQNPAGAGPYRRPSHRVIAGRRRAAAFSGSECRSRRTSPRRGGATRYCYARWGFEEPVGRAFEAYCCPAATGCPGVAAYWPLSLHLTNCGVYIPPQELVTNPSPANTRQFGIKRGEEL